MPIMNSQSLISCFKIIDFVYITEDKGFTKSKLEIYDFIG